MLGKQCFGAAPVSWNILPQPQWLQRRRKKTSNKKTKAETVLLCRRGGTGFHVFCIFSPLYILACAHFQEWRQEGPPLQTTIRKWSIPPPISLSKMKHSDSMLFLKNTVMGFKSLVFTWRWSKTNTLNMKTFVIQGFFLGFFLMTRGYPVRHKVKISAVVCTWS